MSSSISIPMSTTGFQRLPEETLRQIILEIYSPQATESKYWPSSGQDARISWLAASISLSRAWASQAYPILYHAVPLDARWRAVSFLRSITNRPLLAGLVRCLAMFPSREDPASGIFPDPCPWWRLEVLHVRARTKASRKFWQPYFDIRRLCSALTSLLIDAADHPLLDIHPQPHLLIITDIANRLDLSGLAHLRSLRLVGIGELSYVSIPLPHNGTHIDWNLHTLVLHDMEIAVDDIVYMLSQVSLTLRNLTSYSVGVLDGWTTVPMSEWISPVRGSLSTLSVGGYYTELRALRMLSSVTSLEIHDPLSLCSLPQCKPEDYLPPAVEKLSLVIATSGPFIFHYVEHVWRIVKADRTALPHLRQIVVGFTVYNPEDLHTWRLLIFLIKESARPRGVEVQFDANIAYWHGGDSFQWHPPPDRNAGQPSLSVASGSRRSSLFQRSLTLFRRR